MSFKDYIKNKKPVGKKTNLKTVATKTSKVTGNPTVKKPTGRSVYVNDKGNLVSEKSQTFRYKNKIINIPSIHRGYKFNRTELKAMLDEGIIKPTSVSKPTTSKITGNPKTAIKSKYKSMDKKADLRSKSMQMVRANGRKKERP